MAYKMNFDIFDIKFSRCDLVKKIKLPKILTPDLAEIIGIILGDGHLEFNKKYSQTTIYSLSIAGDYIEDMDYYANEINPLFFKLFNAKFKIFLQRDNELVARIYSKAIAGFFKNLGIMPGNKVDFNKIPEIILNSDDCIKRAFVRGIFDTDGSITFKKDYFGKHSKPVISVKMKSFIFIQELKSILEKLGLSPTINEEKYIEPFSNRIFLRHRINLSGNKKFIKYMEIIGFRNPRHSTKIAVWKKLGDYTPGLSYLQRKDMLKN